MGTRPQLQRAPSAKDFSEATLFLLPGYSFSVNTVFMEETAQEPQVPETVEVPIDVREAAAQILAGQQVGPNETKKAKYLPLRQVVGAWVKERRKQIGMKGACWEVGLNPVSVHMWQKSMGIDIGAKDQPQKGIRHNKPRERVYLEEYQIPEPAPTTTTAVVPEEKPAESAGHFSLQVIKMEGDGKTVQSAMDALREFLKPKE